MTVPGNEAELLTRVVSGDREAFDAVMRSHEDRVFSVCLRILGDRERALDATQDTFLTVFRKAGQFQGRSAVGTWIYRIAVNTCYDQLRRAQRRPSESPCPTMSTLRTLRPRRRSNPPPFRPEIEAALAQLPRRLPQCGGSLRSRRAVAPRGGGDPRCAHRDREVPCIPRPPSPRQAPGEPKRPMRPSKDSNA